MKVLIIHVEEEKEAAARLMPLFEKMNIPLEAFALKSRDYSPGAPAPKKREALLDEDAARALDGIFGLSGAEKKDGVPTYALAVSPLSVRTLGFLAGFFRALRAPFLVYGDVSEPPREAAFCFTLIDSEASLREYFAAHGEAYKEREKTDRINSAKSLLLRMGIPLTGESLAARAGEGSIAEISVFLEAGFSPDSRNSAGVPLLNIAARKGKGDIVFYLIGAGARINQVSDDRGSSALFDSIAARHYDIAETLIQAGADLDITSKDGQTALIIAVGAGDEKITGALLKAGANPDITDKMGATARTYAALFHKSSITGLFEKYASQKKSPV